MDNIVVQFIENLLQAEFVGEYSSGHMGAAILRFKVRDNGQDLVVKVAPDDDSAAAKDIVANLAGYEQIKFLGGHHVLPGNLGEFYMTGYRGVIMNDLGNSMRHWNGRLTDIKLFWWHYMGLIVATKKRSLNSKDYNDKSNFIEEVLRFINIFEGREAIVSNVIDRADLSDNYGDPALMLLDFTPDNVFMTPMGISFVDPWEQKIFLGHPAVSIGQFSTLVRIYELPGWKEAENFLRTACLQQLPGLIHCQPSSIDKAYRLGASLQLTLSAYVRRDSEPLKAQQFINEAVQLWT